MVQLSRTRGDFDGEATSFGVTATHTFEEPGDYVVQLTVMDEDFATGVELIDIEVLSSNSSPTASFAVSPTSGPAPLAASFDGTPSSDSDGSITLYEWDFGDTASWSCQNADSSSDIVANHTYTVAGIYTARLTVQDNERATDVTTREIEVTAAPLGPEDLYVDAPSHHVQQQWLLPIVQRHLGEVPPTAQMSHSANGCHSCAGWSIRERSLPMVPAIATP